MKPKLTAGWELSAYHFRSWPSNSSGLGPTRKSQAYPQATGSNTSGLSWTLSRGRSTHIQRGSMLSSQSVINGKGLVATPGTYHLSGWHRPVLQTCQATYVGPSTEQHSPLGFPHHGAGKSAGARALQYAPGPLGWPCFDFSPVASRIN